MSNYLFLIFMFAAYSCSNPFSKRDILGTWTMIDSNKNNLGIDDTTTFYDNGTAITRLYHHGKLTESYTVEYEIDSEKKLLIIRNDSSEYHSKIVELTDGILVTESVEAKGISRLRRLQ